MGNVESVLENFKSFVKKQFVDENWPAEKFWQKLLQHTAQPNGVLSINAKILAFRSLL